MRTETTTIDGGVTTEIDRGDDVWVGGSKSVVLSVTGTCPYGDAEVHLAVGGHAETMDPGYIDAKKFQRCSDCGDLHDGHGCACRNELPELFDDPRGKLDVAADLVDFALDTAPDNALPSSAMSHVAFAVDVADDEVSDETFELACKTVDKALRQRQDNNFTGTVVQNGDPTVADNGHEVREFTTDKSFRLGETLMFEDGDISKEKPEVYI